MSIEAVSSFEIKQIIRCDSLETLMKFQQFFGLSRIKHPRKKAAVNSKIPRKGVVSRGILHLTTSIS